MQCLFACLRLRGDATIGGKIASEINSVHHCRVYENLRTKNTALMCEHTYVDVFLHLIIRQACTVDNQITITKKYDDAFLCEGWTKNPKRQ